MQLLSRLSRYVFLSTINKQIPVMNFFRFRPSQICHQSHHFQPVYRSLSTIRAYPLQRQASQRNSALSLIANGTRSFAAICTNDFFEYESFNDYEQFDGEGMDSTDIFLVSAASITLWAGAVYTYHFKMLSPLVES